MNCPIDARPHLTATLIHDQRLDELRNPTMLTLGIGRRQRLHLLHTVALIMVDNLQHRIRAEKTDRRYACKQLLPIGIVSHPFSYPTTEGSRAHPRRTIATPRIMLPTRAARRLDHDQLDHPAALQPSQQRIDAGLTPRREPAKPQLIALIKLIAVAGTLNDQRQHQPRRERKCFLRSARRFIGGCHRSSRSPTFSRAHFSHAHSQTIGIPDTAP
jgi:hypothetical protein